MPEKLSKRLDVLSTHYALTTITRTCPACSEDTVWPIDGKIYNDGFNACFKELEPLIDALYDAKYEITWMINNGVFNDELSQHDQVLDHIKSAFKKVGIE